MTRRNWTSAEMSMYRECTPPKPDPRLREFERFIGTWDMKGRTLGVKAIRESWSVKQRPLIRQQPFTTRTGP